MPTYVTLVRFTEQGLATIKDGPHRLEDARRDFEALGARVKDFYLTVGRYDAVAIVEAPDDETIAKLSLKIGSRGSSRSEIMRAFSEAEYAEIVRELP